MRDDKKRHYYMISVRGDKRVDLKELSRRYSLRRLSFASANDLMRILGLVPGAVTPLGLLNDEERQVELFLDGELRELIGVHPNDNTATIWLKTQDLIRVIEAHGNAVTIVDV